MTSIQIKQKLRKAKRELPASRGHFVTD